MGGRGGSSGVARSAGLSVTFNGETTEYFFSKKGNTNYYQRGIDGIPEKTPNNISAEEFKNRASKNGASIKNISKIEKSKKERAYSDDKKKRDKWLDEQWYRAAPRPRKGWKGH